MIELRLRAFDFGTPVGDTGDDNRKSIQMVNGEWRILQYREKVAQQDADSMVEYWAWSDWQDVEISDE